jgi:hypothetical protein
MGLEIPDTDPVRFQPKFGAPFGGKGFDEPRATFAPADNAARAGPVATLGHADTRCGRGLLSGGQWNNGDTVNGLPTLDSSLREKK